MDSYHAIDELLIRYLMDDVDEMEREFVRAWIDQDEKHYRHFEEMEKGWRLFDIAQTTDKTDVNKEWQYFNRSQKAPHLKVITGTNAVDREDILQDAKVVKTIWRNRSVAVMIAASFILVVLTIRHFYFNEKLNTNIPDQLHEYKAQVAISKTRIERNLSVKPRILRIDDGSEITLYENSEIAFEEGFPGNKRNITLTGKAIFNVAKDKTKPFTVLSGAVATTALGTRFSVSSYDHQNKIIVRLYEGNIVVKSSPESTKKMSMDYFLKAGNELEYDKNKVKAIVRPLTNSKVDEKKNDTSDSQFIVENSSGVSGGQNTWIMFNNQGLDQVLDQLALIFDYNIIYSKKDIRKIYFIGKFDKSEGLENILENIAELNGLQVISKKEGFVLKKK